jgi:hypothetical protein
MLAQQVAVANGSLLDLAFLPPHPRPRVELCRLVAKRNQDGRFSLYLSISLFSHDVG